MLKNFENWLLENKYSALTAADYMGRVERLCRKEGYTLAHLVENIASILPQYEITGEKSSYGKRSHTSVRQALRKFQMFIQMSNSVENI
jgi:aminoglycoside N3'-acetyltransferase